MLQDIKYSLRALRKRPGFSLVVILTLMLVIGANTVVFSVFNTVLLQPLPYSQPDRLVHLYEDNPVKGWMRAPLSSANLLDIADQSRTLSGLAAYNAGRNYNLNSRNQAVYVRGTAVTGNIFDVLGVQAQYGRTLTPEETWAATEPVVVISHRLYQRLGTDEGIIGEELDLNGSPHTVVGVMPPSFYFPDSAFDVWTPYQWQQAEMRQQRRARNYNVVARLEAGVSPAEVQAELTTLSARLEQQYPVLNEGAQAKAAALQEWMYGDTRTTLYLAWGIVLIVLMIACLNIANMMLFRHMERARENAVRSALGAGRRRLAQYIITECLVLSSVGGLLGLLCAYWLIDLIPLISSLDLPRLDQLSIDGRVAAFTMILSVSAGLIFGLFPAWHALSHRFMNTLHHAGRQASTDVRGRKLRQGIVVVQMAMAVMLFIGAALLTRSLIHLYQVDTGFEAERVLTMQVWLPRPAYAEDQQAAAFYTETLARINALPEVESAAVVSALSLRQKGWTSPVTVEGRPAAEFYQDIRHKEISPAYFRTLEIPVLQGRAFTELDRPDAPEVVVVNERFARVVFPENDPLGRRVKFTQPDEEGTWRTIVGVVRDHKQGDLRSSIEPEIYWPQSEAPPSGGTLVVRTTVDPISAVPVVQNAIRSVDPSIAPFNVQTLDQVRDASVARERFMMLLMDIFALIALLIALVGVYGVLAYSISSNLREIGIRIALGARPQRILSLVLRQGMIMTVTGTALGLLGALGTARILSGLLFEVTATEISVFIGIPVLLLIIAFLACYIPARRATRVDPAVVLRNE